VIGLGPGFTAGEDVHAVVETARGPDLGRVILHGAAAADTGRPAPVMGHDDGRVLRAPGPGVFRGRARIGDLVAAGHVVGDVDGAPVTCGVGGLLRGLIVDGAVVEEGLKVGDVDPRGGAIDPGLVSDKGRAVAAGVLEAVLVRCGPPLGAGPTP
jgi:xanthine dehydrogenase accessory factor